MTDREKRTFARRVGIFRLKEAIALPSQTAFRGLAYFSVNASIGGRIVTFCFVSNHDVIWLKDLSLGELTFINGLALRYPALINELGDEVMGLQHIHNEDFRMVKVLNMQSELMAYAANPKEAAAKIEAIRLRSELDIA